MRLFLTLYTKRSSGKKNKDGERDKSASRSIPYDGGIATAQRESSNCYSFMKKLGFGKAKKENKMEQLMLEGIEDWNNYIDCITAPNSKNYQEMGQTESMVCFFDWLKEQLKPF